jgi:hypothetical protein
MKDEKHMTRPEHAVTIPINFDTAISLALRVKPEQKRGPQIPKTSKRKEP